LVDPGYENQLTSLDEILDSGIEFGYPDTFRALFAESSDLRHKEVVERSEIFSTYGVCLDRFRETGNIAIFVPVVAVQIYKNIYNEHNTYCPINDDDYALRFITTYVQKGSIFLESLNKFIALSIESGMFGNSLRDSLFLPNPTVDSSDLAEGYFVFTLSHFRIAFHILFVGHGLSFLLFLCEVFSHFIFRQVRFCKLIV
jgi:hypothetical protein